MKYIFAIIIILVRVIEQSWSLKVASVVLLMLNLITVLTAYTFI
jgi:hypothetical protein